MHILDTSNVQNKYIPIWSTLVNEQATNRNPMLQPHKQLRMKLMEKYTNTDSDRDGWTPENS